MSIRVLLNGLDYFINSNYHKSKTVKQLSQRAQSCCILLGLCASTAVTKVFEPICFFFLLLFSFSCTNDGRVYSHYDIRSEIRWLCSRSFASISSRTIRLSRSCSFRSMWEQLSIFYPNTKALSNFSPIEDGNRFKFQRQCYVPMNKRETTINGHIERYWWSWALWRIVRLFRVYTVCA